MDIDYSESLISVLVRTANVEADKKGLDVVATSSPTHISDNQEFDIESSCGEFISQNSSYRMNNSSLYLGNGQRASSTMSSSLSIS